MRQEKIEELKNVDIRAVDAGSLMDVGEIAIDHSLPTQERIRDFIEKVKNPFCYLCNGMIVKVSYSDAGESLESRLAYLCMMMDGL